MAKYTVEQLDAMPVGTVLSNRARRFVKVCEAQVAAHNWLTIERRPRNNGYGSYPTRECLDMPKYTFTHRADPKLIEEDGNGPD